MKSFRVVFRAVLQWVCHFNNDSEPVNAKVTSLIFLLVALGNVAQAAPLADRGVFPLGTADPTARVFNGRLYVYTSTDSATACSVRPNRTKLQPHQGFCMPGYRVFSTRDRNLRTNRWTEHGRALAQSQVPWAYQGDRGYRGSARMWAQDVVSKRNSRGQVRYYMFFPAPQANQGDMKIGVAVATSPQGPFVPRRTPLQGAAGIDPSVIKNNGKWYLFTSKGGDIVMQELDSNFERTVTRAVNLNLPPVDVPARNFKPHIEGPFVYQSRRRDARGNPIVWITYADGAGPMGYRIRQARAVNNANLSQGFRFVGDAIQNFGRRTNHNSVVTFAGNTWAFYHEHQDPNDTWKVRRVSYSKAVVERSGAIRHFRPGNVVFAPR